MILHRALHLLLRETGLGEENAPTPAEWADFLRHVSLFLREEEEERARLERSVEIHGREIQSLYEGLEGERRKLALLLAGLKDGLMLLDPEGVVEMVTPEAEWLTGRTEREWRGQTFGLTPGLHDFGERSAHVTLERADAGGYLVRLQPEQAPVTVEETPAPVVVTGPSLRVLLLDDSPLVQKQVETLGHRVVPATDVPHALQLVRKKPADVVVAGTGGAELFRKLRQKGSDVYFILLGAGEDPGADAVLQKPVDPQLLAQKLRVAASLQQKLSKLPQKGPGS